MERQTESAEFIYIAAQSTRKQASKQSASQSFIMEQQQQPEMRDPGGISANTELMKGNQAKKSFSCQNEECFQNISTTAIFFSLSIQLPHYHTF